MTRIYLNKAQILLLHEKLIEEFGSIQGVREETLLDSAIGRYRSGYYADEIEEAAALMESLIKNHPFIDGNKRIAVSAAFVSLAANGYSITLNETVAYEFIIGLLESNSVSNQKLDEWIREQIRLTGLTEKTE